MKKRIKPSGSNEQKRTQVPSATQPQRSTASRELVKVDFAKRLRQTWGNRVFSAAEVAAMRAAELECEQG